MLGRLKHTFDYLFRRRHLEYELEEELRSAFDMVVDRYVAAGMSQAEARRKARLDFEGMEQVKERVRDRLAGSSLDTMAQDVRYAWRGLWRRPSFAVIAIFTLALGIGVNTAVFSVFYGVLLHPLPYGNPERLALIWGNVRAAGNARASVSGPMFGEIDRRNRVFTGVAGTWVTTFTFTGENPEQVKVAMVTTNFFDVLGVPAARGRTFVKEEEAWGRPAIVLSDGFFKRRFGGDFNLVGKGLTTQYGPVTLVGVLPPNFQLYFPPEANVPADVQAFIPFPYDIYASARRLYFIRMFGRLKPGISLDEARRDLTRVAAELRAGFTEYATAQVGLSLSEMHADAVHDVQPALDALFAGASFVLLICCVNVSGLLVARAAERRKEIALRLTVGASRGRIVRQLLVEGGLLAFLGGVAGAAVGWAGFRALLVIRPERLARMDQVGLSWPVLGFAAAASLASAMLFGMAPAAECFRVNLIEALRAAGRGWVGTLHRRGGRMLVVAEIMLAFLLVTSAALSARSLRWIERIRPGFEPRQLLAFQLDLGPLNRPEVTPEELRDWEKQLAAIPGIESVGASSHLPLDDYPNWYNRFVPEGVAPAEDSDARIADFRAITPGYLQAMGTRLVEGRYFDDQDRADGRMVAIVDEMLARSTWPAQSALGKVITAQHVVRDGWREMSSVVVGVVEHVRNHSISRTVRGEVYLPWAQSPRSPLTFVARTHVPPLSVVPAIRRALKERAPDHAMGKVQAMTASVARDIAPAGFTAVLAAAFGALALILAATGIYGVLNYQVSRRMPEMGIRMAVGARAADVMRMVLREGLALAIVGIALGIAGALAASQWLGSVLYGVSAADPWSYGLALVLLPAAALLGCWRPAHRAATANPAETVRGE
jgi:putative ABC transport system permease protein